MNFISCVNCLSKLLCFVNFKPGEEWWISKNLRNHLVRKMVMMILTGIIGIESMAIFSLGTFLSINLRLVMPEEDLVDLHNVGLAWFSRMMIFSRLVQHACPGWGSSKLGSKWLSWIDTFSGREGKAHSHEQSHHYRDEWVPGKILFSKMTLDIETLGPRKKFIPQCND